MGWREEVKKGQPASHSRATWGTETLHTRDKWAGLGKPVTQLEGWQMALLVWVWMRFPSAITLTCGWCIGQSHVFWGCLHNICRSLFLWFPRKSGERRLWWWWSCQWNLILSSGHLISLWCPPVSLYALNSERRASAGLDIEPLIFTQPLSCSYCLLLSASQVLHDPQASPCNLAAIAQGISSIPDIGTP